MESMQRTSGQRANGVFTGADIVQKYHDLLRACVFILLSLFCISGQ